MKEFPTDWPDLEIFSLGIGSPSVKPAPTDNFMGIGAVLLKSASLGTVTINSTSTRVNPLVSPNWLQDPKDLDVLVQAFKRVRELAAASPGVGEETAPGPSVKTDAQITSWLRNNAGLIYHSAAGCKMGKRGNPTAVTDSSGRVVGVTGLRVVDASTIPFLPPGHPQSAVYMLAEKISAEILGTY